ncbi:GAF and ANTAR domain-containing protein [Pseudonocardia asaccharolytica]|uniref:ANTAR domain-containing protein n=1 Tax=Pseudonocardia asaccharolytica DSM 44247 = NBRC 16224 TaxID=1123024 RepID=A0A511D6R7_9PSEU|nr:GAF domain-containing protein [Pseudonocardia asaccharolytica]GEL20481.1 hypothetical protein PA7_43180 [Pseudonocardia asaccharolytica DSM 44247 = NBRC 16224]
MPKNDSALISLVLQVGRTPVAHLDVGAMLAGVCNALPVAVGVPGAVVVVLEVPDPLAGGLFGSDAAALRIGEVQHQAGEGPLPTTVRTGRRTVTPDLTRSSPPELAEAAKQTGLTSAVNVPIMIDGRPAGVLQLLGSQHQPVAPEHADAVRPLVDMLSCRLADGRAFRTASGAVARMTAQLEVAAPIAQATGMLAERYHTDAEEAGRFLASQATKAGVPIAEMAATIVAGTVAGTVVGSDRPEVPAQRHADPVPPTEDRPGRRRLHEYPHPLPPPARTSADRPGGRRRLGEPVADHRGAAPHTPRHRRADIH